MSATKFLLRGTAGAAVSLGLGAAYIRYEYGPETLPRLVRCYKDAIPALAAYKWVQWTKDRLPRKLGLEVDEAELDAAYDRLHVEWAPTLFQGVLELRGFYLKGGQMVAGGFGGAFPRIYSKIFEPLLDKVPGHMPITKVRKVIEGDFAQPFESVFASFEEEPIAAASIGQVHRAVLKKDGRSVVVKVLYPGVESTFRGDIAIVRRFYEVALPEHVTLLDEVEKQFANEFDYRREAQQLANAAKNIEGSGAFPRVTVPHPLLPLCTKNVLVMDEVKSVSGGAAMKLTTALEQDFDAIAASRGTTRERLIEEEDRLNAQALARKELRNGPTATEMERLISAARLRNRFGWLFGLKPLHIPLNHAHLVDELLRVHGHQIFVDGEFNGDPHPGNLLVVREKDGDFRKLALVDYGQVKVLDATQRLHLARVVSALARCDESNLAHRKRVADLVHEMGFHTKTDSVDAAFKFAVLSYDRDDRITTEGRNIQEVIEDLNAKDGITKMSDDFVMASRCSLMLRGLGHMLNQHRSCAKAWKPFADSVMRSAGEDPEKVLG
jgi:aarF domain-containing kinase